MREGGPAATGERSRGRSVDRIHRGIHARMTQEALYALLSLTVVRIVPVAIATLGTRSRPTTVAYLGWFGPRGLASIVFAVIMVEADVPHTSTIVDATALTVTALTGPALPDRPPLTERYTRAHSGSVRDRPASKLPRRGCASRPPATAAARDGDAVTRSRPDSPLA
jgi:sodium/hydrogen antiporter